MQATSSGDGDATKAADRQVELLDLSGLRLEPHVEEAVLLARARVGGHAVSARDLLEGAVRIGRTSTASASFNQLGQHLEKLKPRVPDAQALSGTSEGGVLPDRILATPGLVASFRVAEPFLNGTVWGRDLVTLALLATEDPSLEEVVREGGAKLDALRDAWFQYVVGWGEPRSPEEWQRWYRAAGVTPPGAEEPEPDTEVPTYLLTWNPARYAFDDLRVRAREIRELGSTTFPWSTGNRLAVEAGARVFLLKQGEGERGLVGEGVAVGEVRSRRRTKTKGGPAQPSNQVDVEWSFLSPTPVLPWDELTRLTGDDSIWSTRASGVELKADLVARVLPAWEAAVAGARERRPSLLDSDLDRSAYLERLDDEAHRVLAWADALRLATDRGSVHVEHLLGAILDASDALGPVLGSAGIDVGLARQELTSRDGTQLPTLSAPPSGARSSLDSLPVLSSHAFAALQIAETLADRRAAGVVGVREVIEGAFSVTSCTMIRRLARIGLSRSVLPWAEDVPVRQAGYLSDTTSGRDLLDMTREARNLAAVMAGRTVAPPLSIGLFGEWGSGKSFFMKLLQKEVRALEVAEDPAFCRRVVQIRFNAWHYIDSNLWASLANEVFEQLGREIEAGRPQDPASGRDERRKERIRLLMATRRSRSELEEAEKLRDEVAGELDRAEAEVERFRDDRWLLTSSLGARSVADETLRRFLDRLEVRRSLDLALAPLGLAAEDLEPAEVRRRIQAYRGWSAHFHAWWDAVARTSPSQILVALALVALAWFVFQDPLELLPELAGAIGTGLAAAAAVVAPWAGRIRELVSRLRPLAEDFARFRSEIKDEVSRESRDKLELVQEQLDRAEARRTAVREELLETEQDLRELLADSGIQEFVRRRRESQYYRQRLGVIARARQDFEELSQLLENTRTGPGVAAADEEFLSEADRVLEKEMAAYRPTMPDVDRIILYIDDLDRCPEGKVVDVLQAVHLLLAFKLFVVVVGVDPRWLLHSLAERSDVFSEENASPAPKEVGGRKRYWSSTPMDYLEKIFQIPLHLKPMGEEGFGALVNALTRDEEPEAEGQAGPAGAAGAAAANGRRDGSDAVEEAGEAERPEPSRDAEDPADEAGVEDRKDTRERTSQEGRDSGLADGTDAAADAAAADADGADADDSDSRAPGDSEDPADPDPADPDADPVPFTPALPRPRLAIADWERAFMRALHPFIDSPRSAKRFVNVYRLVRAAHVEPSLVPESIGGEPGEKREDDAHRVVMFLLAIMTGYPSAALELFGRMRWDGAGGPWSAFLNGLAEDEPGDVGPDEWRDFLAALHSVAEELDRVKIPFDPAVEEMDTWTTEVSRYSFRSGQALRRQGQGSGPLP